MYGPHEQFPRAMQILRTRLAMAMQRMDLVVSRLNPEDQQDITDIANVYKTFELIEERMDMEERQINGLAGPTNWNSPAYTHGYQHRMGYNPATHPLNELAEALREVNKSISALVINDL